MTDESLETRRTLLAPEVVQTSAMDCGPASLKCLLNGFGISAGYGRLREACQTDVDGTSIDTIEETAVQLGLAAEQIMIPADHLLVPDANALPAMVVVRRPNGLTHFAVVWRRHRRFVQVMDPATGRRWVTTDRLLDELYLHVHPVPASAWREWAGSSEFLGPLRHRLGRLGVSDAESANVTDAALDDSGWKGIAALDAATRMVDAIVQADGLRRGREAGRVLETVFAQAREAPAGDDNPVPASYWSVTPGDPELTKPNTVLLHGAVLVRVRGRRSNDVEAPTERAPGRSPELAAALDEEPRRPSHELWRLLRADGLLAPTVLTATLVVAAGGVIVEALLLRGLIDLAELLQLPAQRLGAIGAVVLFVVALFLLKWPTVTAALRLGRHLEARLRIAFLEKLPRLGDRYFASRPTSDMAERSHVAHRLRDLPDLGRRLLRTVFELLFTTAGIIWLAPESAPIALLAAGVALALALVVQSPLAELDLRVRTHAGALGRFYLDALLGLVAVRTHGAEDAVRREHESLLVEWAHAGLAHLRAGITVEGLQLVAGFGLAAWLLFDHIARVGATGSILLLVYWALNLPVLGREIVGLMRQYPHIRSITLRLLEPLGAPEEEDATDISSDPDVLSESADEGVSIHLDDVHVRAAGHTILSDVCCTIEPGCHVAIVGPSGAGKTSLIGLLLGWHRAAAGRVLVDGAPLTPGRLAQLRRETAWVDPTVQLWNRSFLDNLHYGTAGDPQADVGWIVDAADLRQVLEALPDGLQTSLGESGGLVSGGEGQRVRFARALLRRNVRLVLLDEPFRALGSERRRTLLQRARRVWHEATLLCITHDVDVTRTFDRVLVLDGGRIIEDGTPEELIQNPDSRYCALLNAENAVRDALWSSDVWRRFRLEDGRLFEQSDA